LKNNKALCPTILDKIIDVADLEESNIEKRNVIHKLIRKYFVGSILN
jgi:hypothetical protein